ncbi:protein decapping 5-like [Phoenix dactylifera]|uniref:Protein decapping 5-like n=1 Tax=Phoenix dactylifera TaxID=42345 RepID=A0A8B7CKH2_PHODC|nr:protein decapping 5-like [Phoenix dactylifera]
MAAESSRSGPSADSYIGSLISLTSKSEIRYEGILYNINTEESSIGLRDVRSFGTEGRKKDGPQIPASDKIYEYILFRGSDIKDLQVKSSPPVQTAPIHNDPAIIQSHYSHPATALTTTSLPPVGSGTAPDLGSHAAQLGLPRPTFQGSLPQYQPGGSLASWGSSPPLPNANGSGIAMPMYWQGYYAPSTGLPHLQQPPLLRPPPGLPIPPSMQQQLQYSGMNASLPSGSPSLSEIPPPLLPPGSSTLSLTSSMFPSTLAPAYTSALAPETLANPMPSKPSITSHPAAPLGTNLPFVPPSTSSLEPASTLSQNMPSIISRRPKTLPSPIVALQTISQVMPSVIGSSSSSQVESSLPLVTPSQLLQPGLSIPTSSESLQMSNNDVEIKPPEAKVKPLLPEPSALTPAENKAPILPLPKPTKQKPNGAALQTYHSSRGRGRGRGNGYPRPVTKFTEDFDFTVMNEKFKKDEVWGHLGKSKAQIKDREGEDEADDTLEDDDPESIKLEIKPVYCKDDFFDSLSCDTLNNGARNGRTKFSEQLKIDTETFGDFARHRPGRGGGRGLRGGRTRGSYYGRGYGYAGRGRGHISSNRAS